MLLDREYAAASRLNHCCHGVKLGDDINSVENANPTPSLLRYARITMGRALALAPYCLAPGNNCGSSPRVTFGGAASRPSTALAAGSAASAIAA